MKNNSNYNKTILDNGVRVVTEHIPTVHSVSIGLWILAGTIDETEINNGIAHFVEHMVFKGTETRSSLEIAESIESIGGYLNAFTGKEYTCFFAHVLDENIDVAIDILSDLIQNPKVSNRDIQKEKKVITEEINELEDIPEELVHEYFVEYLYKPHPLSYSTLGKRDTINLITHDKIKDFMHSNYSGNRIIVAAAGNLDHNEIVQLANHYLNKLPEFTQRQSVSLPEVENIRKTFHNNFQQSHICIGRRSFSYCDHRRYSLLLLSTILGLGMSSRLFQIIREKYGFAYSIYSFADFFKDSGIFGVYLGTDKENINQAIALVIKELKSFISVPISDQELNKRKLQLKGNLLLGLESTTNRMTRLAKSEINFGKFISIHSVINEIENITKQDISDLAEWLFEDEQQNIIILKPK